VEAYQAIICRVFQGTVSWSDLLLILEDRERYRQMDYEVKKAWLRTVSYEGCQTGEVLNPSIVALRYRHRAPFAIPGDGRLSFQAAAEP
jgi:hypothetical protein